MHRRRLTRFLIAPAAVLGCFAPTGTTTSAGEGTGTTAVTTTSDTGSSGPGSTDPDASTTTSSATTTTADGTTSSAPTTGTGAASGTTGATVCGDGVPEGDEACDDGNQDAGDSCDACTIEGLVVFVSKARIGATKVSPNAADKLCDTWGKKRYRGAEFVAWISDMDNPVKDRIGHTMDARYIRTDGATIALGTDEFLAANKSVPIDHDEDGNPLQAAGEMVPCSAPGNYVWTGTDPEGNATNLDCNRWMSTSAGVYASNGRFLNTNDGWTTSGCPRPCSLELHIYCVQKVP